MNVEPMDDNGLNDMLDELRILLQGAQLLTGFLMTLPFSSGFKQIVESEKWVFIGTFFFAVMSLLLFTAPAVQHRAIRPLLDRTGFKQLASKEILAGAAALSIALVLGVNLVISEVLGHELGLAVSAVIAGAISILWWLWPKSLKARFSTKVENDSTAEEK